uniref:phosphoserine phosphatase n=1 Tax=Staphylothermus marinus TaxID=2280 RepID=A0A7C4JKZ7_STAMA
MKKFRGFIWFDCDGVLTDIDSSWRYLHEYFGSSDNRIFMELYRSGSLSYMDWMKIDVALMIAAKGGLISRLEVEDAFSRIGVRRDAVETIYELKKLGLGVGVISSGIGILVNRICSELNVDECLYNDLVFINGLLIPGGVSRVPLKNKVFVIDEYSWKYGFTLRDVVYVGDSDWDIDVFQQVGLAIAVKPCGNACNKAHFVVENLKEIIPLIKKFYGLT